MPDSWRHQQTTGQDSLRSFFVVLTVISISAFVVFLFGIAFRS